MVKSSNSIKQTLKDYSISVLTGIAILLSLGALAASVHHLLAMSIMFSLIILTIYLIWRSL